MRKIPIKAVGCREVGDPNIPSSHRVDDILKKLWAVASCPAEKQSEWTSSEVTPINRNPGELIFSDSGFKERGLDFLGTYHLSDDEVTIYVDSCRQAAVHYDVDVDVDALIEIVLIHELTHLITHNGFKKKSLRSFLGVYSTVRDLCLFETAWSQEGFGSLRTTVASSTVHLPDVGGIEGCRKGCYR